MGIIYNNLYKTNIGYFKDFNEYQKVLGNIHRKIEYIVKYRTIYQVDYSRNGGYYCRKIYYHNKCQGVPLTSKKYGATTMTASEINKLLGHKLLNE